MKLDIDRNNNTPRDKHLGGNGNPFILKNSCSRTAMTAAQLPQVLTLLNSTKKAVVNDGFLDLQQTVMNITVPTDCEVLHIFERTCRRKTLTRYIWYREVNDDTIETVHGIIEIPLYKSTHIKYGFIYKPTNTLSNLAIGDYLKEGAVLAASPNRFDDGQYGFGREVNFAFFGTAITHEDGCGMNREECKKFECDSINHTHIPVGSDEILLDIYSADYGVSSDSWVPFPLPGQKLSADGLVCATRKIVDRFMPLQVNDLALSRIDPTNDKCNYVLPATTEELGNAEFKRYYPKVLDINIITNPNIKTKSKLPKELYRYINSIANENLTLYSDVIDLDSRYQREFRGRYQQTPELEQFIDHCLLNHPTKLAKDLTEGDNKSVSFIRQYRQDYLSEFYITITTVSRVIPTVGYKYTDYHGGKFVVSGIYPPSECPTDEWGRVAGLWAAGESVSNRNNPGQLHEMIYNDTSFHTLRHFNRLVSEGVSYEDIYESYLEWCKLISTRQYRLESSVPKNQRASYMKEILDTANKDGFLGMIRNTEDIECDGLTILRKSKDTPYFPPRKPITYVNAYGVRKTSKVNVRIASKYIVLLEKDGGYFSAVSSPRRGPLGITAKLSSADKKRAQHSEQAPRFGESEFRQMVMAVGSEETARFFALVNNPKNNKKIEMAKLRNDNPMDIDIDIEQDGITLGRGSEMLKHLINTFGADLTTGDKDE